MKPVDESSQHSARRPTQFPLNEHHSKRTTTLLWVDRAHGDSAEFRKSLAAAAGIEITVVDALPAMGTHETATAYGALIFDLTYPTARDLDEVLAVKRKWARLPGIMLANSCAIDLLLWALRARMWDFHVKPVAHRILQHQLSRLFSMAVERQQDTRAVWYPHDQVDVAAQTQPQPALETRPALLYVRTLLTERITLEEAADRCCMSRWHFSRSFKRDYGITFKEFVVRERIVRAKALLGQSEASVTEIAHAVGFNELSNFTRAFTRESGVGPRQFRKQVRGEARSNFDEGVTKHKIS